MSPRHGPAGVLLLGLLGSPAAWSAAFELDFQPVQEPEFTGSFLTSNCARPGPQINCATQQSGGSRDEVTPFLNEIVTTDQGIFYHTIVGLPGDAFVQETYIQRSNKAWQGGFGTSSEGNQNANRDPLSSDSSFSGTGTANVLKTLVRQVVGDMTETGDCVGGGGVCMEFLKDQFETKPKIAQTFEVPDEINLTFVNDMRNKTFSDRTPIDPDRNINTMELTGPDAPGSDIPTSTFGGQTRVDGNFDISTDGQTLRITAGAYTWSQGSGPGNSDGTWTYYANGPGAAPTIGFDPTSGINWESFYDPAQNPVWSYPENQP